MRILMLDLDNFSDINESFGHETANKLLIEVVSLVSNIISSHGIIARYGGDEYSILLPETDLKKALSIAEQIRANVEAMDFSKTIPIENIKATISIGISSFPETVMEITAFREKADASLYKAKKTGRNRVAYIE